MGDESKISPTTPPPEPSLTTEPTPQMPISPPPAYQETASKPPLPPRIPTSSSVPERKPMPSSSQSTASSALPPRSPTQKPSASSSKSRPGPAKQNSLLSQAKGALPTSFSGAKDSVTKYGKFVLEHVKKGEMPWTQWYCCGLVDGVEVSLSFVALAISFRIHRALV
jgi:hypothetical protein